MDFLNLEVVGGVSLLTVLIGVAGVAVFVFVFRKLRRLFRSQTPGAYQARMVCPECRWVGIVATLKPLCKKCGNTNLRHAG